MNLPKNVLVTGVSRGLGLAIAQCLRASGWTVYGTSRRESEAYRALRAQHPDGVKFCAADLSSPDEAQAALFGTFVGPNVVLHALVNNAAEAYDDLVTNLQLDPLERMFATNVFTPMLMTRHVLRNMLLHHTRGSIVHVSSISTHTGYKGLAMYAATKGALEAFSKNTAREWGGRGIRSNCVVPGFMDTAMSATLTDEQRAKIHRRTALQEPVRPESVAATVSYLLSDAAASVTGQAIVVDGGAI